MKRNICLLLIIVFIIIFGIYNVEASSYMSGDVDGNNTVGSTDYILIRKHILNNPKLTGESLKRADVNGDNNVTSLDYIIIKKIILGDKSVTIPVREVNLNKTSLTLNIGENSTLTATINPTNATNKKVTYSSSDTSVATIDSNGKIVAKGKGSVTIKATSNGINATCQVIVNIPIKDPIVPASSKIKYEGNTLKYYIEDKSKYYLTYIWMEDPYNQIKKLDANAARYGRVMTDDELANEGKKLTLYNVGQMVNGYIDNGMISKDKALIAFNASGYWNSTWNPPTSYYNKRSDSWLVVTDGKVTRYRPDDAILSTFEPRVIGITSKGNLKVYPITKGKDISVSTGIYNSVITDGVKNTWSFYPELINNGKNVMWNDNKTAMRQAICQVDSNNYIMFSSKYNYAKKRLEVANILFDLGCQEAFNLDGGGSTTIVYKKNDMASGKKYLCTNNSSGGCRATIEGIYFVEK